MKIEELQNKLKYLFKDKSLNPNSIKNILQKNQLIKEELQKIFSGNSKKYVSVGKLVISFVKDIQFRKCVSCNKQLNYDQTAAGSLYCSNKCKLKAGNNPFSRKQVKDKIKQRIVEKYGVENPAQAEDVRKKIKQTCMEKYGVENPYQADCCKSKAKQTLFKHYKTDCPLNNEAIKAAR